jgi:hypothetical protein
MQEKQWELLKAYYNVFAQLPDGKLILADLEAECSGSGFDDNPYRTAFNLGKKELLDYIKERMNEN